jgi:hypothetical protein
MYTPKIQKTYQSTSFGLPDLLANRGILDIDQSNLSSLLDSCRLQHITSAESKFVLKTDIDQSTSCVILFIFLHRPCLGAATAYRPPVEVPAQ